MIHTSKMFDAFTFLFHLRMQLFVKKKAFLFFIVQLSNFIVLKTRVINKYIIFFFEFYRSKTKFI